MSVGGIIMENIEIIGKLKKSIARAIVGKDEVIDLVIIALLSQGHILVEDVPGVGKTTLANALAKSISCSFSRIQFTPDTLPGDVTGMSVYNMKSSEFEYVKGGIMGNIVLADEINRTSPKTQAALLEAMEEGQVTVDGKTYKLPQPFIVIATQNPVDYLGTYSLPEAQMDRFMMKISIGYPSAEDECRMARLHLDGETVGSVTAVTDGESIVKLRKAASQVKITDELVGYCVNIVNETRENQAIALGASPRATLALISASQAKAMLEGRDYVIPDDIRYAGVYVLPHRMTVTPEARLKKLTVEKVLEGILESVKVPM